MSYSPSDMIAQLWAGNYLDALLMPYTSVFGNYFYGMLFLSLMFTAWIRTRSIGITFIFSMLFGGLFISGGYMPPVFQQVLWWVLVLMMGGIMYWFVFGRRY